MEVRTGRSGKSCAAPASEQCSRKPDLACLLAGIMGRSVIPLDALERIRRRRVGDQAVVETVPLAVR